MRRALPSSHPPPPVGDGGYGRRASEWIKRKAATDQEEEGSLKALKGAADLALTALLALAGGALFAHGAPLALEAASTSNSAAAALMALAGATILALGALLALASAALLASGAVLKLAGATLLALGALLKLAGAALLALGALLKLSSSSSSSSWCSEDSDDRRAVRLESKDGRSSSYASNDGYQRLSRNSRPNPGDSYQLHHSVSRPIKIMTYNVWSNEDLEVEERMDAIGQLIHHYSPDIIFFQEMTPKIYEIFQRSDWWEIYKCSVPPETRATRRYFCMLLTKLAVINGFICLDLDKNSTAGKQLCGAMINAGADKNLFVATSHLQSPNPPKMYSTERLAQAKKILERLSSLPNAVFGGDMNWDESNDGQFPLFGGWFDAWSKLRPDENGWTFDTKSNGMLKGHQQLQKRLDRFVCKLRDFRTVSVEMIGMGAIPGLWGNNKEKKLVPVLPSDHYGLLLTITTI